MLWTDVLNSIPPCLVQRILDFLFFEILIFFRVLTPLKKAEILPKFRPRKIGFLDLLEEEFSENLHSKVVAIEVSFPRSPQMARFDQRISSYSKNTEHVSATAVQRDITTIPGPFGHPGREFCGRMSLTASQLA